ncbi:LysR family transcriptional regulator [Rhodococcus qingshengii]|uniref:LysR family transcriptional regulator n=1 Tax=Rhodococcus qingshengii TaxID=334542 RepID=UPI0036DEE9E4
MNVEVRHLRALVALAESDTLTTAAAVLGTTQPTLSRTLAQLEQILGITLVARTTRAISFTDVGRRFVDDAEGVLDRLDAAVGAVYDDVISPLRLGWAWAGLGPHLVPLLHAWREMCGANIEPIQPADPMAALRHRSIDAAIVRRTVNSGLDEMGLSRTVLYTEKLVGAVSTSNALAEKASLLLSDLGSGTLAVCATAPTVSASLWKQVGQSPHTVTVNNTDEWLTKIALGDAHGLTSATTVYGRDRPDVRFLPIVDSPAVEVVLMWPTTNPHSHVEQFARYARDYLARVTSAAAPPQLFAVEQPLCMRGRCAVR